MLQRSSLLVCSNTIFATPLGWIVCVRQKTDSKREKMSDYLHEYLRQTFGLEQMAVEWAYSFHDAVARFVSDPQIALFWNVLIDQVRRALSVVILALLIAI